MGLDVFVGTLTRYYSGDWETIVQQYGREHGLPVEVIRTNEPSDTITDPAEIRAVVTDWRDGLNAAIKEHLTAPLEWNESESAAYHTDKPSWDGYACLMLAAAYDEHPELRRPERSVHQWEDDPAWQASTAQEFRSRYSQILLPELWLPCEFDFTFRTIDLSETEVWIGSSPALVRQLLELNERTYHSSPADRAAWRYDGVEAEDTFDRAARFGLSIFLALAEASVADRLPMKLDY